MGRALVIFSAIFSAIGGFLFGYDSGIISSTVAQPQFIDYFDEPSNAQTGGIVSAYQGGAIIGCVMVAYLGDILGRKKMIFIGSLFAIFGCALQGGAVTIGMLIAGRFFAGVAVGQLTSTVPIYCAEIAPPTIRGMLSGLLQWMLSWGYFAAQWIGYGCTFSSSSFQWRFPLSFQVAPALVLAIGILFLPESPRWLMEKDLHEDARKNLHRLHYNGHNEDFISAEFIEIQDRLHYNGHNEDFISAEFIEIQDSICAANAGRFSSWREIIDNPSWRRRLLLGCGIQAFGQLSGINVINYYGPRIYESLGIKTSGTLMITGINGTTGIVENTLILLIIDKVGRIRPLTVGAFGMATCMLVNAVLNKEFPADSVNPNGNALRAQVAMNFVFQLSFQALGSISWIYPAETFPTEARALGNALAALTNWCLNLIFAQCSPIALGNIGFNYFYFFFAFNVASGICYILFFPETKRHTLEQVNVLFERETFAKTVQQDDNEVNEAAAKVEVGKVTVHVEVA